MGVEIERKFLLNSDEWRSKSDDGKSIKQGYLNSHAERTVRVRTIGEKGFLTIKGKNKGTTRLEYEYEIPKQEALELLNLCEKPIIEKTRFVVRENGNTWEVDEFEGDNKGLMVAEIELETEHQEVKIPDWAGREVSHDKKYYNASLIKNPYKNW